MIETRSKDCQPLEVHALQLVDDKQLIRKQKVLMFDKQNLQR